MYLLHVFFSETQIYISGIAVLFKVEKNIEMNYNVNTAILFDFISNKISLYYSRPKIL